MNRFRSSFIALATLSLFGAAAAAPALAANGGVPAPAAHKRDLAQEEENRALVLRFSDIVFNQHDLARAKPMMTENYIQHHPRVATGREAFLAFFAKVIAEHPQAHSEVVRSATDGDLVFVHVRSTGGPSNNGVALVNIFRVENGKIAEHWDVVQPVPDTSANDNTMF
jgi:predicted SnoaL-like aldol condensation-catalyzing enzyme